MLFSNLKNLEKLEFPSNIVLGEVEYDIDVVFSKKKSSSVNVDGKKLIFRLSSYLSQSDAHKHFAELLKKISFKLLKNPLRKIKTFVDVLEIGKFEFANEVYFLEYSSKVRSMKFENNVFYVNPQIQVQSLEKRVVLKLIEIYQERVQNYVLKLNLEVCGFFLKKENVSLSLVKSKWGHCTSKNEIMINLKLLNAPIDILNYVIIHELCHIKYKNHSQTYWKEVQKYCPNFKVLRKQLKSNPPELFI